MEARVRRLILTFGDFKTEADMEALHGALKEAISYNLESISDEEITDMLNSLRKCDSCGEYETEDFIQSSSLVLDEDGEHGRICDYCRSVG